MFGGCLRACVLGCQGCTPPRHTCWPASTSGTNDNPDTHHYPPLLLLCHVLMCHCPPLPPNDSGGGHLSVRVFHRWASSAEERDNLLLSVYGRGLDAPLIERLLELPFDIHAGVVDGEIHVAASDEASWEFPEVTGKLTCRGARACVWGGEGGLCACGEGRRGCLRRVLPAGLEDVAQVATCALCTADLPSRLHTLLSALCPLPSPSWLRAPSLPSSTHADIDLHFWDAPDELLGCAMDLLFERDRVYLHKAHGHYGAVPLSVSGGCACAGGWVGGTAAAAAVCLGLDICSPPPKNTHAVSGWAC